ncbi:MAG: pseudouridine synthase [Bacteroidetes bacterium]|nr:pseudouridine synthase [Bacteroidota bacterium]
MTEFNKRSEEPYEKRNSADRRFQRNESGDSYNSNRSDSSNYERRPRFSDSNDRRYNSSREQSGERSFERKPFERKPFEKKQWGDKPYERKPYGEKSFERKPFEKKPYERKPWDDKPYERKPYEQKSFGDKPYERKPYERKSFDDKPYERKPFEKKPYERKPWDDKPFERKSFGDRPFEKKPYERKSFDDKPYERKPYERKSFDDKPFEKRRFDDKPFERKPYGEKSFEKKPFERKPFRKFDNENDNFAGKRPAWFEGKTGISRRDSDSSDRKNSQNQRPRKDFPVKKHKAPKLRMLDIFENKIDEKDLSHDVEIRKPEQEKDEVRLNKFIANAGVCSRREADELILSGKITVNGEVKNELGTRINPKTDNVLYDGQELQSQRKVYILLNKPKDTISTKNDPEGRKTVYDIIAGACNENVEAVGRLDRNTTGVFLFTNDGDLAQKILHPKFNKMKIYHVHLDKNLKADDFEAIAAGVELEDGLVEVDDLQFVGDEKNQVGIQIHTGKNHVVKRIFEHHGYTVEKLDRVYFAGLTKKNLPRGKWRFLSRKEVEVLKQGAYE